MIEQEAIDEATNKYQNDPIFHAKVHLALGMMEQDFREHMKRRFSKNEMNIALFGVSMGLFLADKPIEELVKN